MKIRRIIRETCDRWGRDHTTIIYGERACRNRLREGLES